MENASKALIMAAGVLIALLVIGALLLMFNNLTDYQNIGVRDEKEAQIIEFNNEWSSYNRNNVRGSDIYTLINKVIDYNRRETTKGTGSTDQGQYVQYTPITMTIDFAGQNKKFSADNNTVRLIKNPKYEQSSNVNDLRDSLKKGVETAETELGGEIAARNLVTAMTKIFVSASSQDEQAKVVMNYNSAIGQEKYKIKSNTSASQIKTWYDAIQAKKEYVYTYYEYVQFKRAKFDCSNCEYDKTSGRIIKMEFKFTGKFE